MFRKWFSQKLIVPLYGVVLSSMIFLECPKKEYKPHIKSQDFWLVSIT